MTSAGQEGGTVGWETADLVALAILRPLLDAGGYLPWSDGAMRPAGLVELCNEIVLGRHRRVVELGSGASTVLLARLLRTTGGRLDAVEHDARWAAWVTEQLAAERLQEVARVTHAPLVPASPDVGAPPYYEAQALRAGIGPEPIDLLVVDGPPAFAPGLGLARLPALEVLGDRLGADAVVALDDIARAGEQEVTRRWTAASGLRFEHRPAGIAIGRRP